MGRFVVAGLAVALAIIGVTALNLVAYAGQASLRVERTVPAREHRVSVTVDNPDITLRDAAGSAGLIRVSGTLQGSFVRPVIDHRIELRIDRIEPCQRGSCGFLRGDLLRFDEGGEVGGRKAPEVLHKVLRMTAGVLAPSARHGQPPSCPSPPCGRVHNNMHRAHYRTRAI